MNRGLFIDPSLTTGACVVNYNTGEVIKFISINMRGYSNMKIYTSFQHHILDIVNNYNVDVIGLEDINAVFSKNTLRNYELNVIYRLALESLTSFKKFSFYLIPNPTIRSRLLTLSKSFDSSMSKGQLKKEVICKLMCSHYSVDEKKDIKKNYNFSDALAVFYTYTKLKESGELINYRG